MKEDTLCPMCHRLDEDVGHLFFKCKEVKECWRGLNLEEHHQIPATYHSGRDMMQKIWSFSSKSATNCGSVVETVVGEEQVGCRGKKDHKS
jgi:hypothetical protein